jgi:hypothetical protein
MPNSNQDAAAITLLLNSVPEMWHRQLIKEGTAHHALHWVLEHFDGGTNEFHVDELEEEFHSLKMGLKDTWESYVMRAADISENLRCNNRAVTHSHLVDKIVNGLPDTFATGKSSLRQLGRRMTIEKLFDEIKKEAKYLEIPKPKVPEKKALNAQFDSGNQNQGRNGAKGKPPARKFEGNCHNCGKQGHTARDCRSEWTNYSFRPKRKENGAGSNEEPRALISKLNAGNKGTWADLVDGQEWVVDSGASHHVTGNPEILHDYVEFPEPKLLGTAVKTEVAQLYGQGTVCSRDLMGQFSG